MSRMQTLSRQFADLSWVNKTFLIALVLRGAYPLISTTTGLEIPGRGIVRLLFVIATLLFLIRSFPKLVRQFLWRVRHRLVVTWMFVGVVPIVLICLLVAEGLFFLMGQVVSYMTTSEITRQSELVRSSASALA